MIYKIDFDSLVEDYISIDRENFKDISHACVNSEFNLINKETVKIKASESGGTVFPDFYYDGTVPLFSEEFYENIKNSIQKNIFIKDVVISSAVSEKNKFYKIVLPLRIDCFDKKHSEYSEISGLYNPIKIVIDEKRTGNFSFFKLKNVLDNNIYIKEDLKEEIEKYNPLGLSIIKV